MRRSHSLRRRYGHAYSRVKVAEFLTQSGQIGATISRSSEGDYSYIGKWGAGSGLDFDTMNREVSYWRTKKRGMREVLPWTETL